MLLPTYAHTRIYTPVTCNCLLEKYSGSYRYYFVIVHLLPYVIKYTPMHVLTYGHAHTRIYNPGKCICLFVLVAHITRT